jgi:HSP20 family protein
MLLQKLPPIRDLDLMDRRMHRFFEDLGFVSALGPAADVFETESELVVELEVPGFAEDDLAVEVIDHTLVIRGEREVGTEKDETTMRLRERLERRFQRRFELPLDVDPGSVAASYEHGVLTVRVAKTAEHKPVAVPIETR